MWGGFCNLYTVVLWKNSRLAVCSLNMFCCSRFCDLAASVSEGPEKEAWTACTSSLSFNCNTEMILGNDKTSDFPREIKTWMWWVAIIEVQVRAPTLWFCASLLPSTTSNSFLFTSPDSATLRVPSFVRIFSIFFCCWWVQIFIPLPYDSQFWVLVLNSSIYWVCSVPSWPTPYRQVSPKRKFTTEE